MLVEQHVKLAGFEDRAMLEEIGCYRLLSGQEYDLPDAWARELLERGHAETGATRTA